MNIRFDDKESIKDKYLRIREWVLTHGKIVMPIVLVVCVGITVLVALFASRHEKLLKEASNTEITSSESSAELGVLTTPQFAMELNANSDIDELIKKYYAAQSSGDIVSISKLNKYLNDIALLRIQELSKYIEDYSDIEIYTKPGLSDNEFVAYVCSKVKFDEMDAKVPGMQTYYVEMDSEGNYTLTDGTYDENIYTYIKEVTAQDDVVELNNKVVAEFNQVMDENSALNDYIVYVKGMINESVGEKLAEAEAPAAETVEETEDEKSSESDSGISTTVVNKVKVKERVNVRASDSKEADKVGAAPAGAVYEVVQKKENGWTEIIYEGKNAFINSDYLEDVSEITVEIPENTEVQVDAQTDAGTETTDTATTDTTTVKVKGSGVRIRSEANTTSEVIANVNEGTELEFIEKSGDWSKIKYNGKTGYVKSEFLK